MPKLSVSVIGAGKVGSALAVLLYQRGYLIHGVASRSFLSACQLAKLVAAKPYDTNKDAACKADMVLITTPDRVIGEVVQELYLQGGFRQGQMVFHTSGALDASVLLPAKNAGAFVGTIHPLQSFARKCPEAELFTGCYFALDGDPEAVKAAKMLVGDLGGISFFVPAEDRPLYHAAACIASNYLIALLHWATGIYGRWNLTQAEGLAALMPLIQGTLKNAQALGPMEALTGPISRGDTVTVSKHLNVLPDDQKALYNQLGRYLVELASQKGSINVQQVQELKTLLNREEAK